VKGGMESPGVRRKLEDDENKSRRGGGLAGAADAEHSRGGGGSIEQDNSRFIANQRLTIQQNIDHQDVHLEALGTAADRLGEMSGAINQGTDIGYTYSLYVVTFCSQSLKSRTLC